jgi:hypothetical protein
VGFRIVGAASFQPQQQNREASPPSFRHGVMRRELIRSLRYAMNEAEAGEGARRNHSRVHLLGSLTIKHLRYPLTVVMSGEYVECEP